MAFSEETKPLTAWSEASGLTTAFSEETKPLTAWGEFPQLGTWTQVLTKTWADVFLVTWGSSLIKIPYIEETKLTTAWMEE